MEDVLLHDLQTIEVRGFKFRSPALAWDHFLQWHGQPELREHEPKSSNFPSSLVLSSRH